MRIERCNMGEMTTSEDAGACFRASHCEALFPPMCWCWQPWGKMTSIVKAFSLFISMHTFDLGRNVRNWFLIHRVSESFALSLTKSTMRYALSLQLPIFQGQGCDRGQHWIIRDHKMLWSTELIISFPNPLPFTCCLLPLPSVLNFCSSLEITCPLRLSLNITFDVKPSPTSYMSHVMDGHPTYHLSHAFINIY